MTRLVRTHREFRSAGELMEHYRRVRSRFPRVPATTPPSQPATPPVPPPVLPRPMPIRPVLSVSLPTSVRVRLLRVLIEVVTEDTGMSEREVRGPARKKPQVAARRMLVWLARHLMTSNNVPGAMSCPEIGRWLGRRDHTTVLHHLERAAHLRHRRPEYAAHLTTLAARARERAAELGLEFPQRH
jgi:hypothetical protein